MYVNEKFATNNQSMKKLSVILASALFLPLVGMAEEIKVDSLILNRGLYDSPEYLLDAAVPGVKLSAADVLVRGLNSVHSSSSEPLWIVDGVEMSVPFGQQIGAFWEDKYAGCFNMSRLSQLDFINLHDIESVRVIRNVSETSLYGPKGANGVIIITTKKASSDRIDVDWTSNLGYDRGFRHNHNIAVSQNIGNSSYRVSAFFKDHSVSSDGSGTRFGGVRAKYESKNYKYVWFGANINLAVGKQNVAASAVHDDYADCFRANGNLYLQVNFLPCLKWRTDLSVDSNNSSRYVWNDLDTEMGRQFGRTAALAVATLFDSKATTRLLFDRYFGGAHHLYADAAFDFRLDNCNFNNMDGEGIFTDALRVKGFNLKESSFPTYRVKKQQQIYSLSGSIRYDYKSYAGLRVSVNSEKNALYDDGFVVYPSADVFFDIRKTFFPASKAVSALKLTAGWGKAAFSRYAPWRLVGDYIPLEYAVGKLAEKDIVINENDPKQNIASFFDLYDRVRSSEWHAGANVGFLDGRLGIDAEYYSKRSDDILFLYCFAAKTDTYIWKKSGRSEIFSDRAEIGNKGVEVSLTGKVVDRRNAWMDLRLSGSCNRNSLLDGVWYGANIGAALGVGRFRADLCLDSASEYYLRMPRLEAAYHFPMEKVKWIKGLDVAVSGTNLFTVHNDHALPLFRSVVVGLVAKF